MRRVQRKRNKVSIHAPTWGATLHHRRNCRQHQRFNSRAHVGRDCKLIDRKLWRLSFNSRAHVGRDQPVVGDAWGKRVSIHAPTWGATTPGPPPPAIAWFQFTRPRGARHADNDAYLSLAIVSIHAPTWGATLLQSSSRSWALFQFTRPRGARLSSIPKLSYQREFQFTRPRGARRHRNNITAIQGFKNPIPRI